MSRILTNLVTFWTSGDYKVTRQPGAIAAERKQRQEAALQEEDIATGSIGTGGADLLSRPVEAMTMVPPQSNFNERGGCSHSHSRSGGIDGLRDFEESDYGGPSILRMDAML
jgi:hypothetical protein